MIRINLLPVKDKKKFKAPRGAAPIESSSSSGRFSLFSVLIVLIAFAAVAVFFFKIDQKLKLDKAELELARGKVADVKVKIKRIEATYTEIKRLQDLVANQLEILRALDPPDRLLWSEKLNMLAELIPNGVYLTQIRVVENVTEVQTKESLDRIKEWERQGKKGPAPKVVKKPIIRQILYLTGVTRAEIPEDRLRLITAFNNALKNFSWKASDGKPHAFYDHFAGEIDIAEIAAITMEGMPVTRFSFILQTKPFGS